MRSYKRWRDGNLPRVLDRMFLGQEFILEEKDYKKAKRHIAKLHETTRRRWRVRLVQMEWVVQRIT